MAEAKLYTYAEVAEKNTRENLWMIIDQKVYDITAFVDEHPGGEEVLIDEGARDATGPFEDVGHSPDARELLNKYYIGNVDPASEPVAPINASTTTAAASADSQGSILRFLIPLVVIVAYVYARFFYLA